MNKDWDAPLALSSLGQAAVSVFRSIAKEEKLTYSGGSRVFYSPKEWVSRGEVYGLESELIIQYDGGDARYLAEFNDTVAAALLTYGLYVECCTCWYAAVYKV